MAWSGKLVGGLIGGMLGGPLGAGVGATVGHVLGDSARSLELHRLDWQHHAFSESGPGMVVTPVWTARGLAGEPVRVRVSAGEALRRATVTPEEAEELGALPRVFLPYAELPEGDHVDVAVKLRVGAREDEAKFRVRMPNAVRRLGGSGPARAVMALVGAARAGGRALTRDDVRFIRESFLEGAPMEEDGVTWLRAWVRELAAAELPRLSAAKIAERLDPHLDGEGRVRLVGWLWRGMAEAWPGAAQREFVDTLAAALGAASAPGALEGEDARRVAWATLGVPPGTEGDALRDAWRKLVNQWHPDRARTPEDVIVCNRRMAEVNAAYRLLHP